MIHICGQTETTQQTPESQTLSVAFDGMGMWQCLSGCHACRCSAGVLQHFTAGWHQQLCGPGGDREAQLLTRFCFSS